MEFEAAFRGKKTLITGGLGFIGSNLARRLVDLGAEVLIVDSLIPTHGGNLFNVADIADRLRVNISDVRDSNAMTYLVRGQDYLFNLAGQVDHIDSMRDPFTDLEINCRSQLSILEACRHNNPDVKLIYTATRQQYGKPEYLPVDERHLMQPVDVNGINTMAGEWYHILYNNVYGIRATSLRLTNTYGPRLGLRRPQGVISLFIRQAIDGEEIQLFGDGNQMRDLTYVDDVVEALLMSAVSEQANGQIFNLGAPEIVSLKDAVETLLDVAGGGSYHIVPFPAERKAIDIGDYYADYSRIRTVLGWEPQVGLREGLARTVEFFRCYRKHYWDTPA